MNYSVPDDSRVFIKKFILALSQALDFLDCRITKHHQRVTHISLKLVQKLNLSGMDKTVLFYAGLLHDIGAFSSKDRQNIMKFDGPFNLQAHCDSGYHILNRLKLLHTPAELIRYHHDHWGLANESGLTKENIPLLSQVIHLADRIEVLIHDNEDIPSQSRYITDRITSLSGRWFNPHLVECFQALARDKIFWVALMPDFMTDMLNEFAPEDERKLTVDNMIEMAYLFAHAVDYKSPYTKNHSVQVAELAIKLGQTLGWSKINLKFLLIAGLLHDLGKLSIPDDILEKPGGLTYGEYNIIKRHPYFTYLILNSIPGFDEVAQWALYHHEQIDGKGYPFGAEADNIPQGARIITVADKFVALTEDRPYRRKLSPPEALRILEESVSKEIIDKKIFDNLKAIVLKRSSG